MVPVTLAVPYSLSQRSPSMSTMLVGLRMVKLSPVDKLIVFPDTVNVPDEVSLAQIIVKVLPLKVIS